MKPPIKLKLSTASFGIPDSPESLFRDLKNRQPQIQHLWAHQADILRSYHGLHTREDLALELPTGTGKTLVGLLISEWRRLTFRERVAYLCPTRQLARQVGARAVEYGLKASVLVGRQVQYPLAEFAAYESAAAIAITTYSGLFNTNPRIHDPQTVILDDAHAGENYISKLWSVTISRKDQPNLYTSLVNAFCDVLPQSQYATFLDDQASFEDRDTVELLPGPHLIERRQTVEAALNKHTGEDDVYYGWKVLNGHLEACSVFFSWAEILIRPWVPPTATHPPFASANQRVYMSATLGAAGELERIAGIPSITRIAAPAGWEKQSTGRRLFLMPDRSFTSNEYMPWLLQFISEQNRSLILSSSGTAAGAIEKLIKGAGISQPILHADDIEDTLDTFTQKPSAILSLKGRYDGIDLPGDACRVIILYGLPSSVNLQEEFLWSRLGLSNLLRDKVRTRITQAAGRCTRHATDYAVVVLVGPKLLDFVIRHENRDLFHPELRAEMDFGLENSQVTDTSILTGLSDLLLKREPDWQQADADIVLRRSEQVPVPPPYISTLRESASHEVAYSYALWEQNFGAALDHATRVVDKLSGKDLAGYRALWNYFAGNTAFSMSKLAGQDKAITIAADRYERAAQSIKGVPWMARIAHEIGGKKGAPPPLTDIDALRLEHIGKFLLNLGFAGPKYGRITSEVQTALEQTAPDEFDRGLCGLGGILGYQAEKPNDTASPDSVWDAGHSFFFVFEAKSDESPGDPISVSTCRQAQGHRDWLRARQFTPLNSDAAVIVVSPRTKLDPAAVPHAEGLYHRTPEDLRQLFAEAERLMSAVRTAASNADAEERNDMIRLQMSKSTLTHTEIKQKLLSQRLIDLPRK